MACAQLNKEPGAFSLLTEGDGEGRATLHPRGISVMPQLCSHLRDERSHAAGSPRWREHTDTGCPSKPQPGGNPRPARPPECEGPRLERN